MIRGQVDYTTELDNMKAVVNAACGEEIFFFKGEINNYIDIARSTEAGEASKVKLDYKELSECVLARLADMQNSSER